MTDAQKSYYIDNVCPLCTKQDVCDKNKFISSEIYGRLSIKCLDYEYKNK